MRSKARILVVDDNPAGRYATSHVLRGAGFDVLEAETGTEALVLVEDSVDCVILDVNLPDIDGFEVCSRIRKNERFARLPVIHLSATYVEDVHKVHGLDSGADGYLVHPVEPPVLIATVNAFLRARRAERELERLLVSERAARADADRANQVKDQFLATLSHELRTPLHSILGWTQLLKLGDVADEEAAEAISAIERNAQAQAKIISDLLDISRITTGKLLLDVQPVDPAATIEAALTAILPAATAKNIRVVKDLDPAAGAISGDINRLQQVVWNLVNNAVKFTPKEGQIEVGLRRIDSHVEISVADNGHGIDSTLLPQIFERFRQGDASSTRTHGGLGLGLAIAKQLVELHGGSIQAHSDGPGLGARFTVLLPLSPLVCESGVDAETTVHQGLDRVEPLAAVSLPEVRVLLVDDDADARLMLTRILRNGGAIVEAVDSMYSAVQVIPTFRPQIIVSDVGMPDHDGLEFMRKVRSLGHSFDSLPAIALTGFAMPEDRQRALLAGFQMHIAKPVDPRELGAAIAMLVRESGR